MVEFVRVVGAGLVSRGRCRWMSSFLVRRCVEKRCVCPCASFPRVFAERKRIPSSSVQTRRNPRSASPREPSRRPPAWRERAVSLVRAIEAEKARRWVDADVRCVPSSRRSPRSMAVNSRVNSPPVRSGPTPKSYMVQSQNRST